MGAKARNYVKTIRDYLTRVPVPSSTDWLSSRMEAWQGPEIIHGEKYARRSRRQQVSFLSSGIANLTMQDTPSLLFLLPSIMLLVHEGD